jgi:hypothetical protein
MKLELYGQDFKAGYVSVDPYEYEYIGNLTEVQEFLDGKPTLKEHKPVAEDGEYSRTEYELTGEEFLDRVSVIVKNMGIWYTEKCEQE